MAKTIIFTDLDGTLLHPKTYSFEAAMPALKQIKEKNIPLVFCSSKTRKEIEIYKQRLDNNHPFISENGGGIFIPEGYFPFQIDSEMRDDYLSVILGKHYAEIRKIFSNIKQRIKVKGFGDMSVKEIAVLTKLPLAEARLAKQREFDEPFIFDENESRTDYFLKELEKHGLHWTQGMFFHAMGDNNKGKATKLLISFFKKEYADIISIGLGDSLNDLSMLREVNHPILLSRIDGSYEPRIDIPNLFKAKGVGPDGWGRAVQNLIKDVVG